MTEIQFFWHIYHDVLVEPLIGSPEERIAYIKENKPDEEIELRLRLLKPVRGSLPAEVVEAGRAFVETGRAWFEARRALLEAGLAFLEAMRAYDEAWPAQDEAWVAWNEAGLALLEAGLAYDKAEVAAFKAKRAYLEVERKHASTIEKLHAQECPDCPWDGRTIFGKEG